MAGNRKAWLGLWSLICLGVMIAGIVLAFVVSLGAGLGMFGAGFLGFIIAFIIGSIWKRQEEIADGVRTVRLHTRRR